MRLVTKSQCIFIEANYPANTTDNSTLTFFMDDHKMKSKKLVYDVGTNDSAYVVQKFEQLGYVGGKQKKKLVWRCPYYRAWRAMLERCYSVKFQERNPTYKGCSVTEEWHTFSNFKAWMKTQNWEGLQLDKDLLFQGNKVYGPEACVFVTQTVNLFTTDRGSKRGEWLLGVDRHKPAEKFQSRCSNPFTKKQENLGLFTCEQEAHNAWLKRKLELAHELAAIQTDERVATALVNRYSKPHY